MGTRPSSIEARRKANRKNNAIKKWYSDMMRRLFPQEYGRKGRRYTAADGTTPEKEARINLYQAQALACIPIRYIPNSILLVTQGTHGNP